MSYTERLYQFRVKFFDDSNGKEIYSYPEHYPTNKTNQLLYIPMLDKTTYYMELIMERGPPRGDCDVNVKVDGTDIGTFRLPNMKSILVRRPVFAQQKFLLVRAGSWDALKAGATKDAPKNGEIQVIFHPEDTGPVEQCSRMEDQSAAVTLLGAKSDQKFSTVSALSRILTSEITNIKCRLTIKEDIGKTSQPAFRALANFLDPFSSSPSAPSPPQPSPKPDVVTKPTKAQELMEQIKNLSKLLEGKTMKLREQREQKSNTEASIQTLKDEMAEMVFSYQERIKAAEKSLQYSQTEIIGLTSEARGLVDELAKLHSDLKGCDSF